MNLAIRKSKDKFVVFDQTTNRDKSIKYNDEAHCLRWIKLATGFKQDWRLVEVKRMYGDTATPGPPAAVAPTIPQEEITTFADVDGDETVTVEQEIKLPEQEEVIVPYLSNYPCSKCGKNHLKTSDVGRRHLKHRDKTKGVNNNG